MIIMAEDIAHQMRHIQEKIHQLDLRQSDNSLEVTNQYGYLKFEENEFGSTNRLSQYIRLALQTNAKTVVEFMQDGWCLPTPDLIISVTGGGKQCNMSAHLRKTFQRGLVIAAATTNAWLITAGTNAGVVKEVGKALNNYRYTSHKHGLDVPCIGIGSWDYTAGTEQLDSLMMTSHTTTNAALNRATASSRYGRRRRSQSVQMDVVDKYYVHSYVVKQSDTKRCDLEPNHTHFLLFDGGSSSADSLLLQRAKIEEYSRRISITSSTADTLTPIVMVLVEGGPFSVRTICHALQSNTPLVVVEGSGRAADLVANLHTFYCQVENDENGTEQRLRTRLDDNKDFPVARSREAELKSILEKSRADNNAWVDEIKHDLCQVLYHRKQLVTIFKFDSERHHGNLEDAILEALFTAAKFSGDYSDEQQSRVAEFKLAMAWQKFDYAQNSILTDTTISKWAERDLYRALVDALRRGYVDFVDLLIEYGTSLKRLTVHDLEELYATADAENGLPVDNKKPKDGIPTRNDYYSSYFPDQPDFHQIASDKSLPLGQNAAREFFLWAIFLDRFELGKYLCSKTWNRSAAPLVAARIYQLAAKKTFHSETKNYFKNNASKFDTYAMSIIDRCFDNDEYFAVDLVKQTAVAFGNIEPLKVAEQADCQSFLASKCVQRYLDQKWFGNIDHKRRAIHFRMFICSLFLPLLPFFAIFLPYVHEHKQVIRSRKHRSKNRSSVRIRTVIRSEQVVADDLVLWSERVVYFYQAPIVRFYYRVIFFVIFLALFSFVLLIDYFPLNIAYGHHYGMKIVSLPITEIVLHICTWSLIIEEFRQFSVMEYREYLGNMWNLINVVAIILYLVGFVTRFVLTESFFMVSKIFFCLDLIIWFVGTLHLFTAYERLGPKLVMIFNTMKDLLFFVCFILIFLCGFSITSWSLLTTPSHIKWIYNTNGDLLNVTVITSEDERWTWQMFRDITHYGVWKVFGQVDPIVGNDPYSHMAFVLAIIFVAIANVLLLNVLIALFNVTIQNVQEQSHDLWRYQRFLIVNEYSKKTPLPPPFNIIYYMFSAVQHLVVRAKRYRNRRRSIASDTLLGDFQTVGNGIQQQFKISDEMQRESAIADEYWRYTFEQDKKERVEVILQNIEQKINHLQPRLQSNHMLTVINQQRSNKQFNVESDV